MGRKPRVDRSPEEKWQIVQEAMKSGNVSETCRRHGIAQTLCRKRKQLPAAVGQRVGRLLGKNSRAAGAFEVKINADADGFAKCSWKKMDRWREWARLSQSCYVLRSNVTDWSPEELWRAYMQLNEAEAAFRIQKTDLQLRPNWRRVRPRTAESIRGVWRTSPWSTWCYRRAAG